MRDALRWCIAQGMIALLGVATSLAARATTVVLPLTDLEPQYASQLCWAAADVIAVNSFYSTTCLMGTTPGRTSQAVEAGFKLLGLTSFAALGTFQAAAVSADLSDCETNIQFCNHPGTAYLPGLTFATTPNGTALTWLQAKQQIDAGHPFLFQWSYFTAGTSTPISAHEFVAIGYSDDGGQQQLTVWDPLPVPSTLPVSVPACGPASSNISQAKLKAAHTAPMDFSLYRTPESDMGLAATHGSDQYDLALPVRVPDAPSNVQVDAVQVPAPPAHKKKSPTIHHQSGLPFDQALKQALPQAISAAALSAGKTLGTPFPIIGLELDDLRLADTDVQDLLKPSTSALLFPVESKGAVIGAFLMLLVDGNWHRGGYANTEITRLLVQVRRDYATKEHVSLTTFYLVSVPERAAFFAAHGSGSQAVMIPASSDPSIDAVAEVPVQAQLQLQNLRAAIVREDTFEAKRASMSIMRGAQSN
jgi:hypothetical protein